MTPAGVPACKKKLLYLAGKGHVNFSAKKVIDINTVIKCTKVPNLMDKILWVIFSQVWK